MARLNQDILPAVREAQRAFGKGLDPRADEPRMMRADETFPEEVGNEDSSPYLQQFTEEPGADLVEDLPPEAGPPPPTWRSFASVEDLDEAGNSTGWAYEFDRNGRVKIVSAPEGSRARGVILTSGRAYDAIVDKTAPVLVKNKIRDQQKLQKNAVAKK